MNEKMTLKEWLPLLGITFAAFIFNTSEFMPIALLTDIGADFQISEATAGSLISIYALFVMLLSFPLMVLASKVEFRKLLLSTLFCFVVAQILSGIATSFSMLMLSRLFVACTHAIFWSIATPLGVRVVKENHQSLAMSVIVSGSSIAMIFGMPLGRMIGLYVGWRMTFIVVGMISLAIFIYLACIFPKVSQTKSFSFKELPTLLQNSRLIRIYVLTFLFATAYYTGYSYIDPFLQQVAKLSDNFITIVLMVFGSAGLVGSALFSKFYDKKRSMFVSGMTIFMAIALFLLYPSSKNPATILMLCAFWGMSATACNVTYQAELLKASSQDTSAIAMSIYSGIFNLGISLGTYIGGEVTTYFTVANIGYVGFVIALFAFVYCRFRVQPTHKEIV